ncbi:MAG: hypothetical protein FJ096_20105, partial [Deltaproteobacteria bacterium]|nr:hypothetical protein [Deltaproteobacteria bacterium]
MRIRSLAFLLPTVFAACATIDPLARDPEQPTPEEQDLDEYVNGLPELEIPPAQAKTEVACEGQCPP